jgi:CheY-like chemotaxis protein
VFPDLQMPLQDGFSVIRELRNDNRFSSLPVVAVTASAMIGDRERAIAAGFDSYVAKSIDLCKVEAQVEAFASRWLTNPASQQSLETQLSLLEQHGERPASSAAGPTYANVGQ